MKLKNILIVVSDTDTSKEFYKSLFGLSVISDFGENVVMTQGLVLQENKLWKSFIEKDSSFGGNDAELYFEENLLDDFINKLNTSKWNIEYVNELKEHSWGQRVIRFYDPDKHIIEVGESLEYVARRLLYEGMSLRDVASKTQLTLERTEEIASKLYE